MVRSGHDPNGTDGFIPVPDSPGIATVTLREFSGGRAYRRPQLLDRDVLILFTVGHGTQEVDFAAHRCRPGSLIWARPGQVIRYADQPGLDAIIVSWQPAVLAGLGPPGPFGSSATPCGSGYWQLAGEDEDAVINEVSQLVVDCQRHRWGDRTAALLRHQLAVLLLRLALLSDDARRLNGAGLNGTMVTYQRLRQEVERSYARTRRVEEYAERMRCSVRTLTRACLAATGRSAKQIVDDRVALQARRLLAATEEPVADIGRSLGFPEPTNFGRFFQRQVGQSPGAFRAARDAGDVPHGPVR